MILHQEYLTSNTHTAAPFAEDARGLDRGNGGFAQNIIVDALFSVPASYPGAGTRLYLMRHTVNAGTRTVTFFVGDDDTEILEFVFQLPAVPEQWMLATAENTVDGFPPLYLSGTLVCDGPALLAFLGGAQASVNYGTGLPFEPSAQVVNNPAVTSLDAYDAGPDGAAAAVDGDVTLLSGHNIALTYQGPDADGAAVIRIDAGPGLGRGRWPCDEETYDVQDGPPGLVPLHGDVLIEGDRCYNIVPVYTGGGAWTFMVQGRCQSCCTCDDYAQHAAWQKDLSQRLNTVKQTLDNARALYAEAVDEFNTVIFPAIGSLELDMFGMRGAEYAEIAKRGAPNIVRIVLTVRNGRGNGVHCTGWSLPFTRPAGSTPVIEDITLEADAQSSKLQLGAALNYAIPAGHSISIAVLVSVPLAEWLADPGFACTGTATVTDDITSEQVTLTKPLTVL